MQVQTWNRAAKVYVALLMLVPIWFAGLMSYRALTTPANIFRSSDQVRVYLRESDRHITLTDEQRDRIGRLFAKAPLLRYPNDGKLRHPAGSVCDFTVATSPRLHVSLHSGNLVALDDGFHVLTRAENLEVWNIVLGSRELKTDEESSEPP